MIALRNQEQLAEHAVLVPLIEQIALCVTSGSGVRVLERVEDQEAKDLLGWVVFSDAEERGIGINLAGFVPDKTPLRRRLNAVHQARKVVESFSSATAPFPLYLQEDSLCPDDWRVFRACTRAGSFLCAASYPIPELSFQGIHVARGLPWVRVPLVAEVGWSGEVVPGAARVLSHVRVVNNEQRISGRLFLSEEGIMAIETAAIEQEIVQESGCDVIMRVDLGEVQLPLEQLSALRAGSVVELDVKPPITCFLRVGGTTLAHGELVVDEAGLRLTIKDVNPA
jgi:flagellar motor switch/type III secretory pathway protein FliN